MSTTEQTQEYRKGFIVMVDIYGYLEPATIESWDAGLYTFRLHNSGKVRVRSFADLKPAKRYRFDCLVHGKWMNASEAIRASDDWKRLLGFVSDFPTSVYAINREDAKERFGLPERLDGQWRMVECS